MKPTHRITLLRRRTAPWMLGVALGLAGAGALAQTNEKASRFYEDALVRYEKKDLPGAIIQLKNALQADPNLLPGQLLLGKALMQNGDPGPAEVALLEALRLGVNRAEVAALLGRSMILQGKQKQMLESSTFNPAGLPTGAQVQLLLVRAVAQSDIGDTRAALQSISAARDLDSRSPDVWLAEVPLRIRARQFKEANDAINRAMALAPSSADGWYQKGSVQHVQGDLRGAVASYDKVLQIDPAHVEARVARTGILLDLGRVEDASKDAAELKRTAPREPRGSYLRALIAERSGDAAATQVALKEVTDLLDPVPVDYLRYRPQMLMLNGLAHFGLSQTEKAKPYLEAFQRIQNNSPSSKLLARIYLAEGNAAQAASVLEAYLRQPVADGQAMVLLASAYIALGRPAKATALMEEALKTRDDPAFRTTLGLSLVGGGRTSSGVAELEAAYKKDPQQTLAATTLVQVYIRDGQQRKAIPVAQALVKQQPGNAAYHNLLGMAQGQSGNLPAAREAFEKALQIDPSLEAVQLNLARLEIATKAYDAAAARLDGMLKTNPKNSDAMFELAVIADAKGSQADAQRWLEKARDSAAPKELRFGLALVDFHLRNGRPGPALEAAKIASAKAPDDLGTLVVYSRAQLALGDTVAAKTALNSATRFADYNAPHQLEIARLQMVANNPAGAAYSLDKALSSNPGFLPAQALMAEVELRQGEIPKAEKRARDIVAQYPRLAVGYSLLGDVARARGQGTAAVESYRRAYQAEPSTDSMLRLFHALMPLEQGRQAFQLGEQWTKAHPKDARARKLLANGYASVGNYTAAQASYEIAVGLAPDDADALNNLANVQLRLKNPAAVKTAEAALSKSPGSALITDTLGWALFQNGQSDRALQLLRDARLRQPDNPEIRYHLAAVLAQSGRAREAREELEAALKGGRRFEGSSEAEKLLGTLR